MARQDEEETLGELQAELEQRNLSQEALRNFALAITPKINKPKLKGRRREAREKKRACKGVKSLRGQPEAYSELKKIVSVSVTPTGLTGLDRLSRERSISRSELIEQIGRQILKIAEGAAEE